MNEKEKFTNVSLTIWTSVSFAHSHSYLSNPCFVQPLNSMGNRKIYKPGIFFTRDLPSSISNNTLIPKAIIQRICDISI